MDRRLIVMGVLAVAMTLLAWLLVRPPSSEPLSAPGASPPTLAGSTAPRSAQAPADQGVPSTTRPGETASSSAPEAPEAVSANGHGDPVHDAPADALDPDDPVQQRIRAMDHAVHLVLEAIAPDLDLAGVARDCDPLARRCTFEGPWPGDDTLGRWVRALSDDRLRTEDLEGVTFRTFEPVDTPSGERLFRIVAVPPP